MAFYSFKRSIRLRSVIPNEGKTVMFREIFLCVSYENTRRQEKLKGGADRIPERSQA